jgi:hypothetical protein
MSAGSASLLEVVMFNERRLDKPAGDHHVY